MLKVVRQGLTEKVTFAEMFGRREFQAEGAASGGPRLGVACSRHHQASRALCPALWASGLCPGHSGQGPAPPCWHTGPPSLWLQPLLSPRPALFPLSNCAAPFCLAGCVFYWHRASSLPDPLWAVPALTLLSLPQFLSPTLPLHPLLLSLSVSGTTPASFLSFSFPIFSLCLILFICLSLGLCQPVPLVVSAYVFVSGLVSVCVCFSLSLSLGFSKCSVISLWASLCTSLPRCESLSLHLSTSVPGSAPLMFLCLSLYSHLALSSSSLSRVH